MALSKIATTQSAETGAEITLYHPATNLPLPEKITIYGQDSEVIKRVRRKQMNRRFERGNNNRNKKLNMTAEELEAEGTDLLVAAVKSWRTILPDGTSRPQIEFEPDEWLDCTPENVLRIFEAVPAIRDAVDEGLADRANFLQD